MSIDPSVIALIGARPLVVGFLLPVLIVALVAYGVFELVRANSTPAGAGTNGSPAGWSPAPSGAPAASPAALGILDERFARGEIDAEEYVQRRSLLAPPAAPPAPPTAAPVPPVPPVEPTATAEATEPVTEQVVPVESDPSSASDGSDGDETAADPTDGRGATQ